MCFILCFSHKLTFSHTTSFLPSSNRYVVTFSVNGDVDCNTALSSPFLGDGDCVDPGHVPVLSIPDSNTMILSGSSLNFEGCSGTVNAEIKYQNIQSLKSAIDVVSINLVAVMDTTSK